ncbi:hypothetical protein [Flaviaesturariibacter amylovorans]|uniref:HEAT repeat domain-containing protein n=1 Tax=Flaviaesturariibacter amylovorans TaxID=1084520 RepID=A0ABP8G740_9BACT
MEPELNERLARLEKALARKQKDKWDKLTALTPAVISLTIAAVGWHFTNAHNAHQLELQQRQHESQLQIAYVNASIGQSELIKDFMQPLSATDTTVRNIAIEAVLYAAPAPGKRIVDIIARAPAADGARTARAALEAKRRDLAAGLFAAQGAARFAAASEITNAWTGDEALLHLLVDRSTRCLADRSTAPDCADGIYAVMGVLPAFHSSLLQEHRAELTALLSRLPKNSPLTMGQGKILAAKLE